MIFPFLQILQSQQTKTEETGTGSSLIYNIFSIVCTAYTKNTEALTLKNTTEIPKLESPVAPAFWDIIGKYSPSFFNFTKEWDTDIFQKYAKSGGWDLRNSLPNISFVLDFRLYPIICGLFIIGLMTFSSMKRANSKLAVFYFFFFLKIFAFGILSLFSSTLFFTCSSLFIGSFSLHIYIFVFEVIMAIGFYIHLRRIRNNVGESPSNSIRDAIDTVSYALALIQKYPTVYQTTFIATQLYQSGLVPWVIKSVVASVFTIFTAISGDSLFLVNGLRIITEVGVSLFGPYFNLLLINTYFPQLDVVSIILLTLQKFVFLGLGIDPKSILASTLWTMFLSWAGPKIVMFKIKALLKGLKFVERVLLSSFAFRGGYTRFINKNEAISNANVVYKPMGNQKIRRFIDDHKKSNVI